ncbi:beta-class carbonic anhydrase [Allostreptomyces psammosilenae]|uniref:carbonic anhydrase n=1 Tax=Allostreptomyces psammosilenae TaxID=1892865 RepID=A0A853A9K7_9ACTN|nr:carbonic anhydrase [Allostreptomyces psammosilenae]NYI07092.1 carbonic anhydrase [Allostreptomyces psammosilenae]
MSNETPLAASPAEPKAPVPGGDVIDELVAANREYAAAFASSPDRQAGGRPSRQVAVVTCMDARIDPLAVLGLRLGEAHVVRNAGGVVTDDVIRTLTISQRALGTRAVMVVQHSACGMLTLTEDFRRDLQEEVGVRPSWAVEAFGDLDGEVRQSVERIRRSPFLAHVDQVRGFVYDVETGALREVTA